MAAVDDDDGGGGDSGGGGNTMLTGSSFIKCLYYIFHFCLSKTQQNKSRCLSKSTN